MCHICLTSVIIYQNIIKQDEKIVEQKGIKGIVHEALKVEGMLKKHQKLTMSFMGT